MADNIFHFVPIFNASCRRKQAVLTGPILPAYIRQYYRTDVHPPCLFITQIVTPPLGRRTESMAFLFRPIVWPRVERGNRAREQAELLFNTHTAEIDPRYHTVIRDRLLQ
jgi:hypothetical protein